MKILQLRRNQRATAAPEPWVSAWSMWSEVWEPGPALRKYRDAEPISEDELNELVEYGTLRIVSEDWFTEDLDDDQATPVHSDPEADPSGDGDAEGTAGGDASADDAGDDPEDLGGYDSGDYCEE